MFASKQYDFDFWILIERGEEKVEFIDHAEGNRVVVVRTVKPDRPHQIFSVDFDGLQVIDTDWYFWYTLFEEGKSIHYFIIFLIRYDNYLSYFPQ